MKALRNQYKNIGLFCGSLSSNYHEGIVLGANEAIKTLPANLIVLSGGPMHTTNPLVKSRDALFNIIDSSDLDALIVPLSSLTRFMTKEEVVSFLNRYKDIPIINIGTEYPGLINIMPNYYMGFKKLMHHFIVDHGYKRIVLQRGPRNHSSSNLRHEIYKNILEEYGIQYDENLVIYNGLERNSTNIFLEKLISRNVDYDAIITVNSNTTLSIIDSLKQHNLNIPTDVAVAGMANLSDECYSTPELTLIIEDFNHFGATAVNAAYSALENTLENPNIFLDMNLSIGESCGCKKKHGYHNDQLSNPMENPYVKFLYDEAIKTNSITQFQECIYNFLSSQLTSNTLPDALVSCSYYYKKFIQKNLNSLTKEETLFAMDYYIQMTSTLHLRALRYRKHETLYYINFLRDFGNMLNTVYDLSIIEKHVLTTLGISDCYINIYDSTDSDSKQIRNIISIKDCVDLHLSAENSIFDVSSLVPHATPPYEQKYSLLVFPLIFRAQYYGNLIVNYNPNVRGSSFEALETLISTTVMNELQIQDLLKAKSRFNDMVFTSKDWLFETNTNNIITFCSDSVNKIIDFTSEEIKYKLLDDLIIPGTRKCLESIYRHIDFENIPCCFTHRNKSIVFCTMTGKATFRDNTFVGYRGIIKDLTTQHIQEQKIKNLASYDSLTGLPNRLMFKERLAELIQVASKKDIQLGIIFLNIDHFKKVNNNLGHTIGDLLLQQFAETLMSCVSHGENLARISGDEFAIIVEDVQDLSNIQDLVSNIIEKISKPYRLVTQHIYLTACSGIAMYPADGTTVDDLIKSATSAMHLAKSSGHNQHIFYNKQIDEQNTERLKTEQLLHKAFRTDAFYVEYQPKVDVKTGVICGLEALIRIKSEDGSLIYPGTFIKLAEELDLIEQIDLTVLKIVCRDCADLLSDRKEDLKISVNLSATQLKTINLCSQYMDILNQYGVSPSSIQIELTESALVSNESIAYANLLEFSEKGFSIDLDDFGTGYASLSCFGTYPFNIIKIDRSFITSAVDNPKKYAIISAISDMANKLGISIIAEGVETLPQLKMIMELGIDQVQGYFFEKPRPLDKLESQIRNKTPYEMPPFN